jgi:hypothetical protein
MSDTLADPALLPCPHCGGIAKACEMRTQVWTSTPARWRVWCDTTGCSMGTDGHSRQIAVDAWNRRAPALKDT